MSKRNPDWLFQQLDEAGKRVSEWSDGKKRAMEIERPESGQDAKASNVQAEESDLQEPRG